MLTNKKIFREIIQIYLFLKKKKKRSVQIWKLNMIQNNIIKGAGIIIEICLVSF